tara:strand:- start:442 stop:1164 length:723 start_codon:yes stop_codon:yes gene_type:complete
MKRLLPLLITLTIGYASPQTLKAEELKKNVYENNSCPNGVLTSNKNLVAPSLRVIHVSSNDVLNVRKGAGHTQEKIGELQYNQTSISSTGLLCQIDKNKWVEIKEGTLVGWVNEYYVQQDITRKQYDYPTTRSIDITSNYQKIQSSYTSVEELVAQIADPNKPRILSEPDAEIVLSEQVSSIIVKGNQATVLIEKCCELDDSVAGSRITLHLEKEKQKWTLEKATYATLCYRGANEDSCI